ncbi:hypothetical protein SLS58_007203 [Diplodia intermedia]|uniref:Uncharacterized protein n=1 Tax=Diplodia intermedia TaxID=856260 RepID=A0ABR3TLA3_9PEZI
MWWSMVQSICIAQIIQIKSIIENLSFDRYTDLEYIDTPKVEADLQRILSDASHMHNMVTAVDDVLCQVNHNSIVIRSRLGQVISRNGEYEDTARKSLASLMEMDSVLIPLTPSNGKEHMYILHTLERVKNARATVNRLLWEMQLQAKNPRMWCAM